MAKKVRMEDADRISDLPDEIISDILSFPTLQVPLFIPCTASNSSGSFMAKKVRMEDADRISNLPDEIISHILSFLSTKEAVGTSILSTRWSKLFKLVTNLDFELDDGLEVCGKKRKRSTIKRLTVDSFERFVDRVLFIEKRRIENFHLKCRHEVDSSYFCYWISALLQRGVQHLDLNIYNFKFTTLRGVLFTCRTLVTLKLDIKLVLNVPNYVCFPNLKTLYLQRVEFTDDESVKRLLTGCVSLEDMVLDKCRMNNIRNFNISHRSLKRLALVDAFFKFFIFRLVIDAPMLVYLKYRGSQFAASCENLQSLVSADIDFIALYTPIPHDATSLFKGISEVQSLNLSPTSLKVLSSCVPFPVFPKMVELKIGNDTRRSMRKYYSQQQGLADLLLSSSPKLGKIAFNQEVFSDMPRKVPFCLLYKLKAIDISKFSGKKECIEKAKYFLENAGVVEKLTIHTNSSVTKRKKQEISKELSASPRKSEQCSISIP